MQQWPLTVDRILSQAARWHSGQAVVSRQPDGSLKRGNYAQLQEQARCVSRALLSAGIRPGDTVATVAMNTFDHLAAWYGIMGVGMICHTVNPRLHDDQLIYILQHGGARFLLADQSFSPLVERLLPSCPALERVVWLNAGADADGIEAFAASHAGDVQWGGFPEDTAAGLCYTSGTTGNPKGVLYSHRSNTLLAMNTIMPDAFALSVRDTIMPVVPMFHANTWGLAFSAPMVGARLVLPGAALDGRSLHELIEGEGVTFSAGVPTVWQNYVEHLRATGARTSSLRRVVIGGAACPETLKQDMEDLGVEVLHAWGMTELSPVGLVASHSAASLRLPAEQRRAVELKQGRPTGIDAMLQDDNGAELQRDGLTPGRLMVRGPAVIDRYLGAETSALHADGWFDTGDIATIDELGFVKITDRAKDIIKSGGEWISSVDIENAMLSHPDVALAAVIAVPHDKWGERPKLVLQLRGVASCSPDEYLRYLEGRIARWWIPDLVEIVEAIPIGATGKIDKKALRESA
jgi:fatty-acyl-CoA synthase